MSDASTSFEIDIDIGGGDAIQAAVTQLSRMTSELQAATKATSVANEQVKAQQSIYAAATTAYGSAAKGLERLNARIDEQKAKVAKLAAAQEGGASSASYQRAAAALEKLNAAQATAAAKAATAKAALDAEAQALDRMKGAAARAATNEQRISSELAKTQKAAAEAAKASKAAAGSGKLNEIAEGLGKLGGPVGRLGQQAVGAGEGVKKLLGSLGSTGGAIAAVVVAVAAITAGLVALAAAVTVVTAKVAVWAIRLADGARNTALMLESIAGSTQGASELAGTIGRLADETSLGTDEITGMARELAKTGLRGEQLSDALRDAATAAAQAKFGPNFAKQAVSLDAQIARLKRNLSSIFGGLKIDVLLDKLATLGDLFDANSASAKAIKAVFESVFQPLIDGAVQWIPKLRSNFIAMEIVVMKGLLALKKATHGHGDELLFAAKAAGVLAAAIVGGLLIVIGFLVANLLIIGAALGFVVGLFFAAAAGVIWLQTQFASLAATVVGYVVAAFNSVTAWLSSFSLVDIGNQMINGLIAGITGAGGGVLDAIKGVVGGAVDGAKKLLGIASPSKVFAEIGGFTAEGMAQGVDAGSSDVQSSLESMVAPPEPAAAPASDGGSKGGGGVVINLTVNAEGGDATGIASAVRAALVDVLEGLSAQGGQAVPQPT